MKKALIISLFATVAWCAGTAISAAQAADTGSVLITAHIGSAATLQLGAAGVTFDSANPDTTPSVQATAVLGVTAKARTASNGAVTLTVLASDDLKDTTNTIGINNVTWTVGGAAGYAPGTMNKTTAQTLGSWTGPGTRVGTQTYFLANDWAYVVGNYTANVTYTLSVQ